MAALVGLYGIAARRGDHDTALEYAERMVANAPQRAQSHLLSGDAAFALGQFDDARRSWGRAAALGSKPAASKLAKLETSHPAVPTSVTPPPAADPHDEPAEASETAKSPLGPTPDASDESPTPPA
jgi:tetratricopeptide (TPR) repeat protein